MEDVPDMAELALTGYKSIEEWTGISRESFPAIWHLTGEQAEILNKEIINLLASFNIEIVDIPAGIPREILYDILTDNWDFPVQYLPSSGFDLELCTGVPQTCPYGKFCDCGVKNRILRMTNRPKTILTRMLTCLFKKNHICSSQAFI